MNVNVKLSLTDEQRNVMHRRLTGKNGKGMVTRADVNEWVKEQIERFLILGSPTTETVIPVVPRREAVEKTDDAEIRTPEEVIEFDLNDIDVNELVRQNKLLLSRNNRLQHMLDTK